MLGLSGASRRLSKSRACCTRSLSEPTFCERPPRYVVTRAPTRLQFELELKLPCSPQGVRQRGITDERPCMRRKGCRSG